MCNFQYVSLFRPLFSLSLVVVYCVMSLQSYLKLKTNRLALGTIMSSASTSAIIISRFQDFRYNLRTCVVNYGPRDLGGSNQSSPFASSEKAICTVRRSLQFLVGKAGGVSSNIWVFIGSIPRSRRDRDRARKGLGKFLATFQWRE